MMLHILDLCGVAVFAVTGALVAGRKSMDIFGVIVLAVVTAIGGGTTRDIILGSYPVFWIISPEYVLIALIAAIFTIVTVRFFNIPQSILLIADAIGLAIFTITGTEKALSMDVNPGIAIAMGMITGVVGGMIRDVLCSEIPIILRKEIYATASLIGAITYWLIITTTNLTNIAVIVAIIVIFGLRLSAIRWNLALPRFDYRQKE